MENEVGFLRRAMTPPDESRNRFVVGEIESKTIILLRSGVGPQNAAQRITRLTDEKPPDCVFSIGCAGALSPSLLVGDAVVAETIIDDSANGKEYVPTPELVEKVGSCLEESGFSCHVGTTVTTSEVAGTPEQKNNLAAKYGALAVDMETAQVAEWAASWDIPIVAVRTVSDTSKDSIPPELGGIVGPKGKLVISKAVRVFAGRPKLFREAMRLKRNLDRSLKNLEQIVMSLLKSL